MYFLEPALPLKAALLNWNSLTLDIKLTTSEKTGKEESSSYTTKIF